MIDAAKRVFICGPMTGLPEDNYPAFARKAAELRAQGYQVESPHENPEPECQSWLGYMRLSTAQLATCDAVVMLPGWQASYGARIERLYAEKLGLEITEAEPDCINDE